MLKGLYLIIIVAMFSACGGASTTNSSTNDDPNTDGETSDNDNNDSEGSNIGTLNIVVKSDGETIGQLIDGGTSYTFVNEDGFMGTINPVTGYLHYGGSLYYQSSDCTGDEYLVTTFGWIEENYPIPITMVYRHLRNTNQMYHTTINIPAQRSLCSNWNQSTQSCSVINPCNTTYWSQPVAEITSEASGIQLIYDLPITLDEEE